MKLRRILSILLAIVICVGTLTISMAAATTTQDGLEVTLTTDKSSYQDGERIIVTITVTNTNSYSVNNVTVTSIVPGGFTPDENSVITTQLGTLAAGETASLPVVYSEPVVDVYKSAVSYTPDSADLDDDTSEVVVIDEPVESTVIFESNDSSVDNGTDAVILVLAIAGLAVVIAITIKHKCGRKLLSLILCVVMVGSLATEFPVTVNAETATSSIYVTEKVAFGDRTVSVQGIVSYDAESGLIECDYTRGEWVQLLAELVDMNLSVDVNSIDYYYADTENSEYGIAIETANGYGLLPEPDIEDLEQDVPLFYPDDPATKEFVAYTVVHAMGFDGSNSYDITSWSDYYALEYPDEDAISVAFGFLSLTGNYFMPDNHITTSDIASIINTMNELNASVVVTEETAYDNTEYADGVIRDEISGISEYTVIEVSEGIYTVIIPKSLLVQSFAVDDVIILPANDEYATGISLKVAGVSETDTDYIFTCQEPEIYEVYTHIDVAGTGTAVVSQITTADGVTCEYDPYGSVEDDDSGILMAGLDLIDVGGSTNVPGTLKFTVAEKKITDKFKVSGTVEVEIPDITCILDVDVGLSGITVNEFTMSIQEKVKFKGSLQYTVAESGYQLNDTSEVKGQVELGRIPIAIGTTGLSFDIVFFYNASAKGTASITYTVVATEGYQYKNGAGRSLCDFDDDLQALELKGSAKAGLGVSGVLCAFTIWDMVGYEVEFGAAFDASFTLHTLATDTLYCADATLYFYLSHGLDKDTLIGEFLDKVCHYTIEFQPYKNDSKNPFKLKFHIENGLIVDECTFGMGGITGYVATLDGNIPLSKARIQIYSDTTLVRTLYTDSSGNYSVDNLSAGSYTVYVSSTGYFKYSEVVTVNANEQSYLQTFLMVDRGNSGTTGTISGTITDAVTGSGLTGVSYVFRSGWNNTTGDTLVSGVFATSSYSTSIAAGNYTIEFSKSGYVTNYVNVAVSQTLSSIASVALSPEGITVDSGSVRIVLTWGEYPRDLDSHLFANYRSTSSQLFHTYFSNKNYYSSSSVRVANLDLDDTSSYGPETTTIYVVDDDLLYSFYVHDYTNRSSSYSTALSSSGAKVQVYIGDVCYATYNVPVGQQGTVWHVFDYNPSTNQIIPVNTFSYSSNVSTLQ